MDQLTVTIITALFTGIAAIGASAGFWNFMQSRSGRKSLQTQMLIGLGHDRITYLCCKYISRGWITQDEYENLNDYLYKPYQAMGGNGSAKRLMEEVNKLQIRPTSDLINSKEAC